MKEMELVLSSSIFKMVCSYMDIFILLRFGKGNGNHFNSNCIAEKQSNNIAKERMNDSR